MLGRAGLVVRGEGQTLMKTRFPSGCRSTWVELGLGAERAHSRVASFQNVLQPIWSHDCRPFHGAVDVVVGTNASLLQLHPGLSAGAVLAWTVGTIRQRAVFSGPVCIF